MAFPIGKMSKKVCVTRTCPPLDVEGSPPDETVVLDSYYMSVVATTSKPELQMGGEQPIVSYRFVGHYTNKIVPGCKLHTHDGVFDVISAYDTKGDQSAITVNAKKVADA